MTPAWAPSSTGEHRAGKAQADLLSGEGFLTHRWLSSCCVLTRWKRQRSSLGSFLKGH